MTIKISQLEVISSMTGEEYIPVAIDGENYKIKTKNLLKTNVTKIAAHIEGSVTVRTKDSEIYKITNFDTFSEYEIIPITGTISLSSWDETVFYYYAPAEPGLSGFIINDRIFNIDIIKPIIVNPTILFPVNNSFIFGNNINISSSPFLTTNVQDYHDSSDWQIATDINFTNIVSQLIDSSVNLYTWNISSLAYNSIYYVRVRYKGRYGDLGDWSEIIKLNTESAPLVQTPAVINPINNATGLDAKLTVSSSAFTILHAIDTHKSTEWQIATDSNFISITASSNTGNLINWTPPGLSYGTIYYIRVRHESTLYGFSQWSAVNSFSTFIAPIISKPIINYPDNNSTNIPLNFTVTLSNTFTVLNGTDTHDTTDWQIATDSNFSNIVFQSLNDAVNKTSISISNLNSNIIYYIRARFKGINWSYSDWSSVNSFATIIVVPVKPSITTPINNSTVNKIVNITSSTYSSSEISVSHLNSDWQLSTDINFTNIIDSSINSTVNKTTWKIGINTILTTSNTYYLRVRHRGTNNINSDWSDTITINTMAVFSPSNELGILIASDKYASDAFGWSIDVSNDGTRIAIGAYYAQVSSPYAYASGKVYIFINNNGIWNQEAILIPSDVNSDTRFGCSIMLNIDATRIIIGAYNSYVSSLYGAGKAYIFSRSGTVWTEEAILTASDKAVGDNFGYSVSISGDGTRVVIGAYLADPSGLIDAGKAYIFSRSGTIWTEEVILTASDKAVGDNFAISVSISGDGSRIAVGSHKANPLSADNAGKAYIFVRSGTVWTEEAILTASNAHNASYNWYFGCSVSLTDDGARVVIGAYGTFMSVGSGKAYIFSRSGTTWTEEAILAPSDLLGGYFGFSVDISGDGSRVVVGSYLSSTSGVYSAGRAYMYKRSGITWIEEAIILPSGTITNDYFGYSVSISKNSLTAAIGAPYADPSGISNSGKAYVYG